MAEILKRIIEIVALRSGVPAAKLSAKSAIDQDVKIAGDDVAELVSALAEELGEFVWQWPWRKFASPDEGLSLLFPIALLWLLLTWPLRGSFEFPSQFERLELGHIAAVIEKGEWFDS